MPLDTCDSLTYLIFTALSSSHKAASRLAEMAEKTEALCYYVPLLFRAGKLLVLSSSKPPSKEGTLCSRHFECMNHFYCMPYM